MADQENFVKITREFDAPVDLVWKMWTEPEMMKKWWGPNHYSAPTIEIDFKVGGKCVLAMMGPDKKVMYSGGTYQEIIPHKKIIVTDSFTDKDGNKIKPSDYGMPDGFPDEMTVKIEFEEVNGPPSSRGFGTTAGHRKTKMTITHGPTTGMGAEMLKSMNQSWNESLDKMAAALKQS